MSYRKSRSLLLPLAAALAFGAAACGSPASSLCSRLDECNALAGQSVEECTDNGERSLERLSSSRRSDCEASIERCNELEACENFLSCQLNCSFVGNQSGSVSDGSGSTGD